MTGLELGLVLADVFFVIWQCHKDRHLFTLGEPHSNLGGGAGEIKMGGPQETRMGVVGDRGARPWNILVMGSFSPKRNVSLEPQHAYYCRSAASGFIKTMWSDAHT